MWQVINMSILELVFTLELCQERSDRTIHSTDGAAAGQQRLSLCIVACRHGFPWIRVMLSGCFDKQTMYDTAHSV